MTGKRIPTLLGTIIIFLVAVLADGVIIWQFALKEEGKLLVVSNAKKQEIKKEETGGQQVEEDIIKEYITSKFRVLKVIPNPYASYSLIVATERSVEGFDNDTACGSIYTSPTCYFFIEPKYEYGAPSTEFVARWEGGLEGFGEEEFIKFKDADNVEFEGIGGDVCAMSQTIFNLNIKTKEISVVKVTTKSECGE